MTNQYSFPESDSVAIAKIKAKDERHKRSRGVMGFIFGLSPLPSNNIAAFVIACCFLGDVGTFVFDQYLTDGVPGAAIIYGGLTTLIGTALGYVFGVNNSSG